MPPQQSAVNESAGGTMQRGFHHRKPTDAQRASWQPETVCGSLEEAARTPLRVYVEAYVDENRTHQSASARRSSTVETEPSSMLVADSTAPARDKLEKLRPNRKLNGQNGRREGLLTRSPRDGVESLSAQRGTRTRGAMPTLSGA